MGVFFTISYLGFGSGTGAWAANTRHGRQAGAAFDFGAQFF